MIYVIYCRYEHWTKDGKEFNKWFKISGPSYQTKDDAIVVMKKHIALSKETDKKLKLKHEYEIREVDETLMPQSKLRLGKGRYKKVPADIIERICVSLTKKDKVLLDEEYGKYIFNTEEIRELINTKVKEKLKTKQWVHFWYDNNKNCYALLKNESDKVYDI